MSKHYKLRELINRLEELSKNGRNDGMTVEVLDADGDGCNISNVYIDRYVSSDDEYEFIALETSGFIANEGVKEEYEYWRSKRIEFTSKFLDYLMSKGASPEDAIGRAVEKADKLIGELQKPK